MNKFANVCLYVFLCVIYISDSFASDLPLLYKHNLEYIGAFKVPVSEDYSYGGLALAYNSVNNSLFIVGNINSQKTSEISIPTPVNSTDLAALNRATQIQAPMDITEGRRGLIGPGGTDGCSGNGCMIGGLLVDDERLIGTSYAFYGTAAVLSHFTSGTTLATTGDVGGMYAVGSSPEVPTASYVSGWMAHVPSSLQSELGGPAITGNGTLSVISRTSAGPSAFSFDPSRLGIDTPVSAEALLYYNQAHPTLGADWSTNPNNNSTTKIAGAAMVEGSRSVLYFGYHGYGPFNYGGFSSNPIFADECSAPDTCVTGPKGYPVCADKNNCTTGRKGIPYDTHIDCSSRLSPGSDGCYYDPTGMGDKGPHAYPYRYQIWAYDANDMAAVKTGTKQPWEVLPYAVWEMPFEVKPTALFGGATTYDAATGRLYVTQPQGEKNGCCTQLPVIHVFQVNLSASEPSTFAVKGKAITFSGELKLRNNGGDEITLTASNRSDLAQSFTFPTGLAKNSTYNVSVSQHPTGQSCSVEHGSGTIDDVADITEVVVHCHPVYSRRYPFRVQTEE